MAKGWTIFHAHAAAVDYQYSQHLDPELHATNHGIEPKLWKARGNDGIRGIALTPACSMFVRGLGSVVPPTSHLL